jgi:hypothetical protein
MSVVLRPLFPTALAAAVVLQAPALAAPPTLEHLFPPSARPGSTNELTGVGTLTPWPAPLVFNHPGIRAVPTTNSPRYTLTVDASVPPGTYLARALNDEGASAPRFLIVDPRPTRLETEPNDAADKAQPIPSLPAIVEGRLEKRDDVDTYEISLSRGRTLVARVEAFILGSPLDAVLRLRDHRGSLVTWNHDDGFTFDPFLHFTAPADGKYRLEVFGFPHPADSDIRFTGNARCVYRLHLDDGPYAFGTEPAGLSRSNPAPSRLLGWNLGPLTNAVPLRIPAQAGPGIRWTTVEIPDVAGPPRLPAGDGPESLESREANDSPTNHTVLPVPGAATGIIAKPRERDRYAFQAIKGVTYRADVQASALGSPLDASLAILDTAGKELAQNDDASMGDPSLSWKAPSNGTFIASVGSPLSKAGPDHRYRLEIQPIAPGIRAVAAASSVTAEAGRTNELKVTLERLGGLEGTVRVEPGPLPEGVTVAPAEAAAGANEVTVQFISGTNAPAAQVPLQLFARSATNGLSASVLHAIATTGENNGVPQGFHQLLVNDTDWLWLTVRKPAAKP